MSIDRTIAGKIKINSFTDLIGGDNNEVCEIELKELHDFKDHPFKVKDDEKMQEMAESIKKLDLFKGRDKAVSSANTRI